MKHIKNKFILSHLIASVAFFMLTACNPFFGASVISPAPTLSVERSTLSISGAQVAVGGAVSLTLNLNDTWGRPYSKTVPTVVFGNSGGTSTATFGAIVPNGPGVFTASLTGLAAGTPATITATIDGSVIQSSPPVTVQVTADSVANHAPVATAQSVNVLYSTTTAITLAGTDSDGDTLTYTVVTAPAHGSLSGSAPTLTYTPTNGYSGADSFTFEANDGAADSYAATVSLSVGYPTLYFYNDGTDSTTFLWNRAGNWFLDAAHTQGAGRNPADYDHVRICPDTYALFGANDDPAPLTLSSFQGFIWNTDGTNLHLSNVTIASGGSLFVTGVPPANCLTAHNCINYQITSWSGSTMAGVTATLEGAYNFSTINGNVMFTSASSGQAGNFGTINGDATFSDATFNFVGGEVTGNAAFNGFSFNEGVIQGDAVFNGTSTNNDYYYNDSGAQGTVNGVATFNEHSSNGGLTPHNAPVCNTTGVCP